MTESEHTSTEPTEAEVSSLIETELLAEYKRFVAGQERYKSLRSRILNDPSSSSLDWAVMDLAAGLSERSSEDLDAEIDQLLSGEREKLPSSPDDFIVDGTPV